MDELLNVIEEALRRRGISASAASMAAVGNPSLIKNLRTRRTEKDRQHPYENIKALAEVLGLEFYVGPPRDQGSQPPADEADFAQIPFHDAALAAGEGFLNDSEVLVGHLAFRRSWLSRVGVPVASAVLARASGDSMAPSIHDGDMLLIDRSKTQPPLPSKKARKTAVAPIFALLDDGEAKVKRVQLLDTGFAMLMSDNPDHPPQFANVKTLTIIGKVVWWGHTNRD
jgi:phage repressor protein C with HTH and peptisase S24 domain